MAACGGGGGGDDDALSVVGSFYPLAEAAARVGGDRVDVSDLTPPGAEPHDVEPGPDEVDALLDADVAVVLGGGFQPAVERLAERRDGPTVAVLAVLGLEDEAAADPHVWLDPALMAATAQAVAEALAAADPGGAEDYRSRAADFRDELRALDGRFGERLGDCVRRTVVVTHGAYAWMLDPHGVDQEAIVGAEPSGEPDPRTLARLARLVEDRGVEVVFTEPGLAGEVAETLARETGVRLGVLDPLERMPAGDAPLGESYVAAMDRNLDALVDALGCR